MFLSIFFKFESSQFKIPLCNHKSSFAELSVHHNDRINNNEVTTIDHAVSASAKNECNLGSSHLMCSINNLK